MLPGLHKVRRAKASRVYEYWYAWRGGPQILSASASTPKALDREVTRIAPAAVEAFKARLKTGDKITLYGLVTQYLEHMEAEKKLAPRTKSDRRKHLGIVRAELGEMTLKALESNKAAEVLIKWRDRRAHTPKTADDLLGALSTVLTWGVKKHKLPKNPVEGFERIYSVNRAELIWEPHHLATILAHADRDVADAIRLAAATGLRKNDLIALPWSAVKGQAIVWQTGKSRGRKTVVIPMTDDIRAVLDSLERGNCVTVLRSSDERPWKAPGNGLDSGVRRARLKALEHAKAVHGPDAVSGIEGLRFHDLRGTAATNFIRAGLSMEDAATIMGWELDRVREIARRYVSAEAIGMGMIARMERTRTERKL